jgi:hypothetical protein
MVTVVVRSCTYQVSRHKRKLLLQFKNKSQRILTSTFFTRNKTYPSVPDTRTVWTALYCCKVARNTSLFAIGGSTVLLVCHLQVIMLKGHRHPTWSYYFTLSAYSPSLYPIHIFSTLPYPYILRFTLSTYSPQHSILKHPYSICTPNLGRDTEFRTYKTVVEAGLLAF